MQNEEFCCGIYIVTDPGHNVFYVGMSTRLPERVLSHKEKLVDGFARKYNCTKLVYYEVFPDRDSALMREKQIKGWTRTKKAALIGSRNVDWKDLFEELVVAASRV